MTLRLLIVLASLVFVQGQRTPAHLFYGPHVAGINPWVTKLSICNNGDDGVSFEDGSVGAVCRVTVYLADGEAALVFPDSPTVNSKEFSIRIFDETTIVFSAWPEYIPEEGELVVSGVDGWLEVSSESDKIVPKISFRYADEPAICEFFLSETASQEQLLVNPQYSHFDWLGLALINPLETAQEIGLTAYRNGLEVGTTSFSMSSREKYVRISSTVWNPPLQYAEIDQIRLTSSQPLPLAMSITGNNVQDRFLFFLGKSTDNPISVVFGFVPSEVLAGTTVPVDFTPIHREGKPLLWYAELSQPSGGGASITVSNGGPIPSGQIVQTSVFLPDPGVDVTLAIFVYDLEGHSRTLKVH